MVVTLTLVLLLGSAAVFFYEQNHRTPAVAQQRYLLGTYVEIKAMGASADAIEAAVTAAFAEIARVDHEMRRAGDGELGRLNRSPKGTPFPLSDELLYLLEQAVYYHELSHGKFDVTMGKIVDAWGFTEDWDKTGQGLIPSADELSALLAVPRYWALDRETKTVLISSETVEIDLGGIAKGYAVDRAVEQLRKRPISGALVNAGGNIRVFQSKPRRLLFAEWDEPFEIAIQHPRNERKIMAAVALQDGQAIATSGDYQRYFFGADGRRYHHILDPATGRPVTETISATVLAPTAVAADALSTAVFALGPARGVELIEALKAAGQAIETLIVTAQERIARSSGWEKLKVRY